MNRSLIRWSGVLALIAALAPPAAVASSHSEAPGTSRDRLVDDTDLYAWVASDARDMVTIVGNWVPLIEPNSGPNFTSFDEQATYYINIDNVGDAKDHIRYAFRFRTERRNPATFLYNTGVVTSLDDPDLNVRQFCTVTRYDDGAPTVLASDVQVAPSFVGPASMPDYGALASQAVRTLPNGTRIFIGPRDDPFFVDLAAVFDLLTIRRVPGNKGKGVDGLGGFDVMTIALQIPKTSLTSDHAAASATNGVIGIYDSAERPAVRTLNGDGTLTTSGADVQVSRLGNPLVNEAVIALQDKDRFNATKPTGDGAFLSYVTNPELAGLLTALYGIPTPPAPRNDLVAVFLTGIPGLNKPANPAQVPCEMLRLNMTISPADRPSRFGLLGGDLAGFPNGRRLADDVLDIAERVVAGATPFTPAFNVAPNNQLGDGVDANDVPFLPQFPYVAPPHNPFDHSHHDEQHGASVRSILGGDRGADRDAAERGGALLAEAGSAVDLEVVGPDQAQEGRLEFTLPEAGHASLRVFDLQGRSVRELFNRDAAAGTFVAKWDGRDDSGAQLAKGIYFVQLRSDRYTAQKKVLVR